VALIKFHGDSKIDRHFLKVVLASQAYQEHFIQQASGSTQKFIPLGFIRKLAIPLPDLETQRAIVAEIEAEQVLVNANKQLIERFEAKIKTTINRVWGAD
ncbi:MAG: restriction endonuclease subunit S, partial [Sideroxyarcus sp.]|nr:restriction endonuclease subunit S [Sideroxyarcus sp.]